MASRFDALMATHTPTFLAEFGDDVVINNQDSGINPRTIKAILDIPLDLHVREGSSSLQFRSRVIQISARDNVEGAVLPKVRGNQNDAGGMTLTLPGDAATWYVHDIQQTDAGMHTLEIVDNDV